ncbi:MAG TPA: hypothetical protein GX503_04610 [Clostridiales bacterium]|nr:hypothetical protein [Clostridiales bacterium]
MIHYILFFIGIVLIGVSLFQLKINLRNASVEVFDEIEKEQIKLMNNISDAEKIMEGFHEIGHKVIQDLDERIQRIESLILSADEKIENIQEKDSSLQMQNNNHITENEKCGHDESNNEDAPHQKYDENKEILNLLEEGYSPQEIAKQLNKGIGEVQLICNLAKR